MASAERKGSWIYLILLGACLFSTECGFGSSPFFRLKGASSDRVLTIPLSLLPPGGDSTRYDVSWRFESLHGDKMLSLDGIEPLCFEDRNYCDSLYADWLHRLAQKDTIRATWFSGVLENLVQPVSGDSGQWLSPYLHQYIVEHGILQSREVLHREGFFYRKRYLARGYRTTLDGHWKEQLSYEVSLFADSINALMIASGCPAGDSVLTLRFHCDELGALSVSACNPQVLTQKDLHALSCLQQCLDKLPPFALTLFYTSAGKFHNERLMKGYYLPSKGWIFCDELQQDYARFTLPNRKGSCLVWIIGGACVLLACAGIVFVLRSRT